MIVIKIKFSEREEGKEYWVMNMLWCDGYISLDKKEVNKIVLVEI